MSLESKNIPDTNKAFTKCEGLDSLVLSHSKHTEESVSDMLLLTPQQPVLIGSKFYVGFLIGSGSGSCGHTKSYAIFTTDKETNRVVFSRFCTRSEKNILKKILYFERAIKSVRVHMQNGEICQLFYAR